MLIHFEQYLQKASFLKIILILGVVSFIAYANSIPHPFVHDDVVLIQNNPHITRWDDLSLIFLKPPTLRDTIPIANTYYRPLLEIFYKIQYLFFGLNPYSFHLCNVILHIVNGILIYLIMIFLTESKLLPFSVAMLFLIHPVQSEAVACISGISNLLYTMFLLCSFVFYLFSETEEKKTREILLYIVSLISFVFALFTKEQALVLPLLIILYEVCFIRSQKRPLIQRGLRLAGILILAFGYLWLRKIILKNALPEFFTHPQELWLRILSIPRTLIAYFKIILFPVNLHYYRNVDTLEPFIFPTILLLIIIVAIIFLIRSLPRQDLPLLIFGLGWFLVALLPTLNILPLIIEYSYIFNSEHFLYFPLLGFLLFFVIAFTRYLNLIFQKRGIRAVTVSFLLMSFIFTGATVKQNTYWRGEIPLFERTLTFEKHLGRVHILLAQAYYFHHDTDKAIAEYQKALGILEGYTRKVNDETARRFYMGFIKEIHFGLAHCYEAKSDFNSSMREYEKILSMDPQDSVIYNNLGVNYLNVGNIERAMEYFKEAVGLNSHNVMAINNLALCYIQKGNPEEAERLLTEALAVDTGFISARQNLEHLLQSKKTKDKTK